MNRAGKKLLLLASAAVLATAGIATGAVKIPPSDPSVQVRGGIDPKRLPKDRDAPISIHGGFWFTTTGVGQTPPLREFDFELDRHISLATRGLPACRFGGRNIRGGAPIQRVCHDSIVGKGSATVLIAFPESPPLLVKSNATVFYGRMRRPMREDTRASVEAAKATVPALFTIFDLPIPVPTTVVIPVTAHRLDKDIYGYRVEGKIPVVAGGSGSLLSLRLRIGKRWTYKGRRYSLLSARCPVPSRRLLMRSSFLFADEETLAATLLEPCKVRR